MGLLIYLHVQSMKLAESLTPASVQFNSSVPQFFLPQFTAISHFFIFFFFFFFTAIQCTFTLFPSPNSTIVSKLHASHNSIIAITTFALISRPISVHVTVNKHSGE
jgi:hypothetical protein